MAPPLSIKDRMPSIFGWLAECNSFGAIHKVLMNNHGKNGIKLGLIRGPEYATVDGGLIVDPPDDFPFEDPNAALEWLRKQEGHPLSTPLEIHRLDAKFGSSPPKAGQWVPFYIVTVPEFPRLISIVPMRSWRGIYRTMRRSAEEAMTQGRSQLPSNDDLVFNDLLAPYAVHENDLYEGLTCIVNASRQKLVYVNPSNAVEYHGWTVPEPDKTAHGVLSMTYEGHDSSVQAIERLREFMENVPGMQIVSNPIRPLVCDMFLYDEGEDVSYNVEHKSLAEVSNDKPLKPKHTYFDPKFNWHFLLVQQGENLAIHTRSGHGSAKKKPHLISMVTEESGKQFARIIKANGPEAKTRLREKWKQVALYDASTDLEPGAKDDEGDRKAPVFHRSTIEVAHMGFVFRAQINEQCYTLRRHACILLHNHPTADAVMIEHDWTSKDQELYKSSGLLPVSLVGSATGTKRCILLKFVPHHRPEGVRSTSELFELAANTGWTYPVCTAQDFVFVAMTGGFAMPDQLPCLDNVVLLPSSLTTILPEPRHCTTCEDRSKPRQWNWVRTTIGNAELSRSSKGKSFSFPASPYMKSEAEPLNKVYNLNDGSVHDFFHAVFSENNTRLTTAIHGSSGLLQRQWNHGDMKLIHDNKAHTTYRLIQRVLVGLSRPRTLQNQPFVTAYDQDFKNLFKELRNKNSGHDNIITSLTMREIVKPDNRGITLRELIQPPELAIGTNGLRCDNCSREDTCTFLHPEIVYTLPDADYKCGRCHELRLPCIFTQLPEHFLQYVRTSVLFRAHVPCHACWKRGKVCDNSSRSCKNCESSGITCERVACEAFHESRDNWFCPRHCDKAHYNDGYDNVCEHPRPRGGYNAQIASRKAVLAADARVATCIECWRNHGDEQCTNADICPPCATRMQNGELITCTRIRCATYTECSNNNCKFAHATQMFQADDLIDYEAFPRRRQGALQAPYV